MSKPLHHPPPTHHPPTHHITSNVEAIVQNRLSDSVSTLGGEDTVVRLRASRCPLPEDVNWQTCMHTIGLPSDYSHPAASHARVGTKQSVSHGVCRVGGSRERLRNGQTPDYVDVAIHVSQAYRFPSSMSSGSK